MEDRKSLIRWIKDHKKQMIIAGISIGTLILIILGIKNRAAIKAVWDSLKGVVKHPTAKAAEEVAKVVTDIPPAPASEIVTAVVSNSETLPFEVSRHIRTLDEPIRGIDFHSIRTPTKVAAGIRVAPAD